MSSALWVENFEVETPQLPAYGLGGREWGSTLMGALVHIMVLKGKSHYSLKHALTRQLGLGAALHLAGELCTWVL